MSTRLLPVLEVVAGDFVEDSAGEQRLVTGVERIEDEVVLKDGFGDCLIVHKLRSVKVVRVWNVRRERGSA